MLPVSIQTGCFSDDAPIALHYANDVEKCNLHVMLPTSVGTSFLLDDAPLALPYA